VASSPVPRAALSIASKVHSEHLDYESLLREAAAATDELGLDIIDVLYVHWPAHSYDPERTFAAMSELLDRGRIRNVGVCNFTARLLREAKCATDCPIAVNQVEMHPFLQQDDLLEFCRSEGIEVVAHTPFAGGLVFESDTLREIAEGYEVTIPQIVLAWLTDRENVSAVPKATDDHIRENYDAMELSLDEQDIEKIAAMETEHRIVDYEFAPWNRE
jgi:2,5-diketo-D-gluconate reductase B